MSRMSGWICLWMVGDVSASWLFVTRRRRETGRSDKLVLPVIHVQALPVWFFPQNSNGVSISNGWSYVCGWAADAAGLRA
ncbi:hypothetical protein F5883DRAFT_558876 [Diaporthe sp. PMI_573]|nr:hypothetical protein F5883DRAFT_558876 [Diaporthaceae sp. PMI_573]